MAVIQGHLGWPLSGGWSLLGESANGGYTVYIDKNVNASTTV